MIKLKKIREMLLRSRIKKIEQLEIEAALEFEAVSKKIEFLIHERNRLKRELNPVEEKVPAYLLKAKASYNGEDIKTSRFDIKASRFRL